MMKIIFFILITFVSCSKNIETNNVSMNNSSDKEIIIQNKNLNPKKIKTIISKKWFSKTIQNTDKTLIFHSVDTSKSINNSFIVEFKPDGNLNFENTTKKYLCGNGIPYFDKATWNFKKGLYSPELNDFKLTNNLILHIRGGKLLENRFEFKREYVIESISENRVELKQVNSILEKYITDGNNFFKE